MDDPDFTVSVVKLDGVDQEVPEEAEISGCSSFLSRAKDIHLLWESLRKQGQLFRVLDSLTAKMAQLTGKIQTQTASDEESATLAGLLTQFGIMLVDVETKPDGNKEERYTFVTTNDSPELQQSADTPAARMEDNARPGLTSPAGPDEADEESESDPFDPTQEEEEEEEPASGEEKESGEPAGHVCEWCKTDQGSVVALDLHKVRSCRILLRCRPRKFSADCPTCGQSFRRLARLLSHLMVDHEIEAARAAKIVRRAGTTITAGATTTAATTIAAATTAATTTAATTTAAATTAAATTAAATTAAATTAAATTDASPRKEVDVAESRPRSAGEDDDGQSPPESAAAVVNAVAEAGSKGPMVCEVCQEASGTRIDLRTHLMEGHNFSRQRAVSSVYKSVKLAAQLEPPPPPQQPLQQQRPPSQPSLSPTGAKRSEKDHVLDCPTCGRRIGDRQELVEHLAWEHSLALGQAQRDASRCYRVMNANFACDLCPSRYCDRYVLGKHMARVHQFPKKQAQARCRRMYPSATKKAGRPAGAARRRDNNAGETPSAARRRRHRGMATRRSARKAMEQILEGPAEREEDEEDLQENDAGVEPSSATDGEANDKESVEKGSDAGDQSATEPGDSDEDYLPSEPDERDDESGSPAKGTAPSHPKGTDMMADAKVDAADGHVATGEGGEESLTDGIVPAGARDKGAKPAKKTRGRKSGQLSNAPGGHKCPTCEKTFRSQKYVKVHMASCHKENPPYQCSTCQKAFYVRTTFIRHLTCHQNEEQGIRFPCEVCGKSFYDKQALGTHAKTHLAERPFKCDFCDRSFFHQSLLARHRNLHTKETEYKCGHCDKVFYRKGGLKYHVLAVHENKRDHVCPSCGQGFASRSILQSHEQTHSSQRPFQCHLCGARVKTKGNLKEHMLCVHSDRRDFKCDLCQKTFNRSHRLTLHMMMHRDERPHQCHLCDKAFRTRTNLTVHVKWHRDQRDFQCEQCGKTFLIPGNLERHMQTHRPGKKARRNKSATPRKPSGEQQRQQQQQQQQPQVINLAQRADQAQLPVQVETEVCQTVDGQFQTVHNLVEAGNGAGGFESDLPTLASIAQQLSTMNIPVFQVPPQQPASSGGGVAAVVSVPGGGGPNPQAGIPVTIHPADSTCTPLPGSITCMSREASMALAAFTQQQMQSQGAVVSQPVQASFEQIELTM